MPPTNRTDRGHPIFAAFYDRMARVAERRGLAELRREVLQPAQGLVVEIGAGTGLNFRHYPPAVTEVVANPTRTCSSELESRRLPHP